MHAHTRHHHTQTDVNGGSVATEAFFTLSDPFGHVNFTIVADSEFYPSSLIPVHPAIPDNNEFIILRLDRPLVP
jgi:hypothetical protein